jgi:undecaprenyl-diphosphatase
MIQKQSRLFIAGFVTAAASLGLFAWLADQVLRGGAIRFDGVVREGVHAWASPPLTYLMRGMTWLGSTWVLIPLTGLLVWVLARAGRRRAGALLVIAAAGAECLDQILKVAFHRVRPEPFFHLPEGLGYSFPSGHSVVSASFFGVLAAILSRRIGSRLGKAAVWTAAALLALGIGLSRIYLGVHYPTDVLAGYAAAVIWVAALRAGYGAWLRRGRRSARP